MIGGVHQGALISVYLLRMLLYDKAISESTLNVLSNCEDSATAAKHNADRIKEMI